MGRETVLLGVCFFSPFFLFFSSPSLLSQKCVSFISAIHFEFKESQQRCVAAYAELKGHVAEFEKTMLEPRNPINKWSLIQADRINLSIKGILGCIKNLLDYNENDVIVVVAQNIQLCF